MSIMKTSCNTLYSIWIFFLTLDLQFHGLECISQAEIDNHLQMGVQLLAKGQLHDALSHFHAAIDGDPKNYLSYYRRATVFLGLGRSVSGLHDLDEVLRIKPDFTNARIQRAGVLLKMGRLDESHIDLEKALRKDPSNEEANNLYVTIDPVKQAITNAQYYQNAGRYEESLHYLKEAVEACPWYSELRLMRVEAYEATGMIMEAIADLRVTTKLIKDDTAGFLRLSKLYYKNGDVDQGLSEIRECLKLDPDHKECFTFYKKVKKVAKVVGNLQEYTNNKEWEECVTSANKILKEEKDEPKVRFIGFDKLCQCQVYSDISGAINACNAAIEIHEEARTYCDRAEAYLKDEMWDEALADFQKAHQLDEHLSRAKEGIEKSQKLKKQAGKRDYYKILGIKRSASKKEITKAYRSLAQKWHPDQHPDENEKKKAEKMFMDIAAAKEVLSDAEMRNKFDAGEDPLDPEQQQGGGGHPFGHQHFHQQGFPGGGGGQSGGFHQHFKFHFN